MKRCGNQASILSALFIILNIGIAQDIAVFKDSLGNEIRAEIDHKTGTAACEGNPRRPDSRLIGEPGARDGGRLS